jgi:hypothetical protein
VAVATRLVFHMGILSPALRCAAYRAKPA